MIDINDQDPVVQEADNSDNKHESAEFPSVAVFDDALPESKRMRGTRQDYLNWTENLIKQFNEEGNQYTKDYTYAFAASLLQMLVTLHYEVDNRFSDVENNKSICENGKFVLNDLIDKWDVFSDKLLPFMSNPELATDNAIESLFKEINRFNKQIGEIRRLLDLRYQSSWSAGSGPSSVLKSGVPLTNETVIFDLLSTIHNHKTSPMEKTALMLTSVLGVLDERCANLSTSLTYFQFGRGHFMREQGQQGLQLLFGRWKSVHNQCRDAKEFIEKRIAMNHILRAGSDDAVADAVAEAAPEASEKLSAEKAEETKE